MAPCKSSNKNQQWDFQHNVITYPFPLEYIPTIKELKQKRDQSDRVNRRKPKIIETRTQQNTGPFPQNQTQPIISDAPNVPKLSNEDREILSIENQQFVGAQAIKHETQLANEVRQLYCRITTLQRNQAMILAQTNKHSDKFC
jgi:hypothetical protein